MILSFDIHSTVSSNRLQVPLDSSTNLLILLPSTIFKDLTSDNSFIDLKNIFIGIDYFAEGFKDRSDMDKALEFAIKRYVGGASYKRKIKSSGYINSYYKDIMIEYRKLQYIYKGIADE